VFLFDAFYASQDEYRAWLNGGRGVIRAAYTEHLADEHTSFRTQLPPAAAERFLATPTTVDHDAVVQEFFPRWVHELPDSWKVTPNN
jgi:hypothetical protein